jgi:hypothetical protein
MTLERNDFFGNKLFGNFFSHGFESDGLLDMGAKESVTRF